MLKEWARICCTVLCLGWPQDACSWFFTAARTTRIRLFKQALVYAKCRHLYAGLCRHTECRKSHSNPWGLILWESLLSSCRPLAHPVDSSLTSCDTFTSLKKNQHFSPHRGIKGSYCVGKLAPAHGYISAWLRYFIPRRYYSFRRHSMRAKPDKVCVGRLARRKPVTLYPSCYMGLLFPSRL